MAADVDQLVAPLVPAQVRGDLILLATLLGLSISIRPTDPTFQLIDWLAKWLCYFWNAFALPAIRGQFGATAAGAWLTAWALTRGVSRPLAGFATGSVTWENRSGVFVDISAVGAVSITVGGVTYVSQGPPVGSTGTMAAYVSGTGSQTLLVMQATQTGSAANLASGAVPGYPTAPASAPAGVYPAAAGSSPPAPSGIIAGSDVMSDPALVALVRAAQALSASPGSPAAKYLAIILQAKLPSGTAVATSRVQLTGSNATATAYCATPTDATPGSTGSVGTELYQINAAVQIACAQPGLTIVVRAANRHSIALGDVVIYVAAQSGISAPQAVATATAAFTLWQSLIPVGGERLVGGGTGYVLYNALTAAFQDAVNPTYPAQWTPDTLYGAGATVSNLGQTFVATSPGTSAGLTGPSGSGGADGTTGLVWAPSVQTGGGGQFTSAPGVVDAYVPGISADVALAVGDVPVFTYSSISALIVQQ